MSRTAKPGPPSDPVPPPSPPEPSGWRRWVVPAVFLVMLLLFFLPHLLTTETPSFGYTELLSKVDAGQVDKITIDGDGAVKGNLRDGTAFRTQLPVALKDDQLLPKLRDKGVQVTGEPAGTSGVLSALGSLLPLLLLVGFMVWMGRGAQRSLAGAGGFGRSKAKIIEAQRPTTRFADVAGYEGVKQEVSEVVDFLRDPERYAAAGAKGPRGVIMVGPPGTGKTLLARAVAGEASVPFLSVTGSEFVEMFVGVGASRVRDLFTEARNRAPSIIFIDEIDAVGSRRGIGGTGGHDEREQTLNQLLAEMDGFDQSSGIVVLAATNRPESLDRALLRPGRFDRQVTVPLPNQDERAAILAVHVTGKHLGPDVDLRRIARGTPGFSGADLANLVNEGAINAVRAGRTTITAADLDSARDRVLLGRRETSNALLPEERHAVAVHESGHALMAALCEHADPVAKVTILPAGMALGATEQLPEAERHLYSEAFLTDLLTVRLGGRAAELVVFKQGSTGAADDLAGATELAVKMVTEFGLSSVLGPVAYPAVRARFLTEDPAITGRGGFSEKTQQVIDDEVSRLLRAAEDRAVRALRRHRKALDLLATELLSDETVDGSVVLEALRSETEFRDLAS
ncbi:ATP-dependent zinc metalloprotease FtsH [Amycolatopsis orientalis]|uniref:ATP-dependent zinc metalloprotease FtsH n=1 Tax=Amycolatopsis orientalis TaxID=31958 RepID=UPI0009DE3A7A|nr:ATP-dependent zinc metalloprotease FtsH [Amycolatopsis orientalis]